MSRYLTPSKIALLALISLYTESVIPSTAIIPVLSFLVQHVVPAQSSAKLNEQQYDGLSVPMESFQKATINLVSGIPGRTIWDLLLHKLWKIDSLDALHAFFDSLEYLLQKTPEEMQRLEVGNVNTNPNRILLSRVSPLGAFLRRTQVEFTRLQFHDAFSIWKSFIAYRAPTLALWKKRNSTAGPTSFDVNLQSEHLSLEDRMTNLIYGDPEGNARKHAIVSTFDVEYLLDFQVERMQSEECQLAPRIFALTPTRDGWKTSS